MRIAKDSEEGVVNRGRHWLQPQETRRLQRRKKKKRMAKGRNLIHSPLFLLIPSQQNHFARHSLTLLALERIHKCLQLQWGTDALYQPLTQARFLHHIPLGRQQQSRASRKTGGL